MGNANRKHGRRTNNNPPHHNPYPAPPATIPPPTSYLYPYPNPTQTQTQTPSSLQQNNKYYYNNNNHPTTMALNTPYRHVDSSLKALAGQAEGFGRNATGGLEGDIYHVTNLSDDGPGSLRMGCRKKEPLWIVFDVSGEILLNSYLSVSSHKTIDGRGQRITLKQRGLRLKECENVIICNLEFEDGVGDDMDGIQIKPNSKNIWIDRCTLKNYEDGLIDITRASTDITISRCHFHTHNKTMLIGAHPSHTDDRVIRVTIHHCFFDGTHQRHPRVRFGKVHLYNNLTRDWVVYAVCASVESQIYSQCNIYEASRKNKVFEYYTEKAADKEEEATGRIKSEGDLFINGAEACNTSEDGVFHPSEFYDNWTVEPPNEALKVYLTGDIGCQNIALPPLVEQDAKVVSA